MSVIAPDPIASAPSVAAVRPPPAAATPIPTLAPAPVVAGTLPPSLLATPPSVDTLAALLQSIPNATPGPAATSDIARLYSENAPLASPTARAPVADGLTPADAKLLTGLSDAYRTPTGPTAAQTTGPALPSPTPNVLADAKLASGLPQAIREPATATPIQQPVNVQREIANAQLPNAPATAGNTPVVIIVDGRTISLSPAQAANVRATLGLEMRKLGPGVSGSDAENPTLTSTSETDLRLLTERGLRVQSVDTSARSQVDTPDRHQRPQNEIAGLSSLANQNEEIEAVRAVRHEHPAPYEPELILPRPQDQTNIAPGPDRVILAGHQATEAEQAPAINGIAIALAPGITANQLIVEHGRTEHRIGFVGSTEEIVVQARPGVPAQLIFADGTSLRLHLG